MANRQANRGIIAMVATSVILLLVSRAGLSYGVGTADMISVFLTPFQTLNAEYLPDWFNKRGGGGRRCLIMLFFEGYPNK